MFKLITLVIPECFRKFSKMLSDGIEIKQMVAESQEYGLSINFSTRFFDRKNIGVVDSITLFESFSRPFK